MEDYGSSESPSAKDRPHLLSPVWTPADHLRHSKFVGLRDDKEAKEGCAGGGLKRHQLLAVVFDNSLREGVNAHSVAIS